MEQVEGDAEAREEEGGADADEGAGPGQEQQQGVMDGGEEEGREPQDQPEQRGGEPGVQRQGGQEEGRQRLAHRCRLEMGKYNRNKSDGDSLKSSVFVRSHVDVCYSPASDHVYEHTVIQDIPSHHET